MGRFKKYLNAGLSVSSLSASLILRRPLVMGYPPAAGIELTNHCNLGCRHCVTGSGNSSRARGYMDRALYEKIISDLEPWLLSLMFYFQGESMMHTEFFEMLRRASGCKPVVSTNGHFLTYDACRELAGAAPSRIIVSMDGFSQESYSAYRRGGDFEKVKEGIVRLAGELRSRGREGTLEIQTLVTSSSEPEMAEIRDFAGRLGVVVRFKSMQLLDPQEDDSLLPGATEYNRYIEDNGKRLRRGVLTNRCARLWLNPVITWDGLVVPCCFDKNIEYPMGDLKEQDFRSVWRGEKYREFRNQVLTGRAGIDICRNCTEGLPSGVKR